MVEPLHVSVYASLNSKPITIILHEGGSIEGPFDILDAEGRKIFSLSKGTRFPGVLSDQDLIVTHKVCE